MAKLSGKWTLRSVINDAGWKQGILISGSAAHDGIQEMPLGTEIHRVQGEELTIMPYALNPTTNGWEPSLEQEVYEWRDDIGLTLTISADDNPPNGDKDYNDLVVLCVPEDDELISPHVGFQRPDLTIPERMVRFR
jgi:hypothetical protein